MTTCKSILVALRSLCWFNGPQMLFYSVLIHLSSSSFLYLRLWSGPFASEVGCRNDITCECWEDVLELWVGKCQKSSWVIMRYMRAFVGKWKATWNGSKDRCCNVLSFDWFDYWNKKFKLLINTLMTRLHWAAILDFKLVDTEVPLSLSSNFRGSFWWHIWLAFGSKWNAPLPSCCLLLCLYLLLATCICILLPPNSQQHNSTQLMLNV